MPYALSILDKSPIPTGATAAEAVANTVVLARRAEDLGYKRFWVADTTAAPSRERRAGDSVALSWPRPDFGSAPAG